MRKGCGAVRRGLYYKYMKYLGRKERLAHTQGERPACV